MARCLRCNTKLILDTKVSWSFRFYGCPNCNSQYSKAIFRPVCDRWLMPITFPLYDVLFDKEPQLKAKEVAQSLLSREQGLREAIKNHVRDELETPKQKVSKILNLAIQMKRICENTLKNLYRSWSSLNRRHNKFVHLTLWSTLRFGVASPLYPKTSLQPKRK